MKYYVYGRVSKQRNIFILVKVKQGFSHINQKVKRGIKDPKYDIISNLRDQGGPEIDIIRHGLNEYEALLLVLYDAFDVSQITNKVRERCQ